MDDGTRGICNNDAAPRRTANVRVKATGNDDAPAAVVVMVVVVVVMTMPAGNDERC